MPGDVHTSDGAAPTKFSIAVKLESSLTKTKAGTPPPEMHTRIVSTMLRKDVKMVDCHCVSGGSIKCRNCQRTVMSVESVILMFDKSAVDSLVISTTALTSFGA